MLTGHLWELIIVLVIALVIFGPKRLPELGSSLGKGIREFRKATNELQESINVHEPEPLPQSRQNYSATSDYTAPRSTVERPAPAPAPAEYVATPAHGSEHEPPSRA